jgi:hypothetical protein
MLAGIGFAEVMWSLFLFVVAGLLVVLVVVVAGRALDTRFGSMSLGGWLKRRINRWLDKKVDERNKLTVAQDIKVMNEVQPALTPRSRSKELMMPADKVILQYRDKLAEFEARGWRLDMTALRAAKANGDVIFAIPCPARRETHAWVLDEVPRVAAAGTAPTLQTVGGS